MVKMVELENTKNIRKLQKAKNIRKFKIPKTSEN
jgi:hypothetical protein